MRFQVVKWKKGIEGVLMGGLKEEVRDLMLIFEDMFEEVELQVVKIQILNLEQVLKLVVLELLYFSVVVVWCDVLDFLSQNDILLLSCGIGLLMIEDVVEFQVVGYVLVKVVWGGYINCVCCLWEIQREKYSGSIFVSCFNVFVFLKVVENGYQEVIWEFLWLMIFVSMVMMGYVIVMKWKEKEVFLYLFVKKVVIVLGKDWIGKFLFIKDMFLVVVLIFCFKGWELKGLVGVVVELYDCICVVYSLYLFWWVVVIFVIYCYVEVFKVLFW